MVTMVTMVNVVTMVTASDPILSYCIAVYIVV